MNSHTSEHISLLEKEVASLKQYIKSLELRVDSAFGMQKLISNLVQSTDEKWKEWGKE